VKKIFIIVNGVYVVLAGLLISVILVAALLAPNKQQAAFSAVLAGFIIMDMLGLGLIATGVGVILKKNWARISLNIISALALFEGVIMSGVFFLFPMIMRQKIPADTPHRDYHVVMLVGLIFSGIFFVIIPAFFLAFFNNKGVKDIFVKPGQYKSLLPFGIKMLAVMFLLGGILAPLSAMLYISVPIPLFFGITLIWPISMIYALIFGVINVYLGIGFFKLNKKAWITAICLHIYTLIGGVSQALTIKQEELQAIMSRVGGNGPVLSLGQYKLAILVSMLFVVAIIVYLWWKRGIFSRPKAAQAIGQ